MDYCQRVASASVGEATRSSCSVVKRRRLLLVAEALESTVARTATCHQRNHVHTAHSTMTTASTMRTNQHYPQASHSLTHFKQRCFWHQRK